MNVPGIIFNDASKHSTKPLLLHHPISFDQAQAMNNAIAQRVRLPGYYNVSTRNCGNFVEDMLVTGGMQSLDVDEGEKLPRVLYTWLDTVGGWYGDDPPGKLF